MLCCFLKKKKKKKAMVQETDAVNVTDHVHVHETVLPGPHGGQLVAMTVDEDINVQGMMRKNEMEVIGKGLGVGSAAARPAGSGREKVVNWETGAKK